MKWVVANAHYLEALLHPLGFRLVQVQTEHAADEDFTRFFHTRLGASIYNIRCPPHCRLNTYDTEQGRVIKPYYIDNEERVVEQVKVSARQQFVGFAGLIVGADYDWSDTYERLKSVIEEAGGAESALFMRVEDNSYAVIIHTEYRCGITLRSVRGVVAFLGHDPDGVNVEHCFRLPLTVKRFILT